VARDWLLITVSTPGGGSSTLRVYAWRKLRSLGAHYLQQSVCLLPATPTTTRATTKLVTRLRAEGGHGEIEPGDEFYDEADHDTVVTIKDLLETRVRPAVAGDGGDITFRGYKEGVVYLEMKGACSGCPSSTATLRHGVQNLFRHFLPEIREVQAI